MADRKTPMLNRRLGTARRLCRQDRFAKGTLKVTLAIQYCGLDSTGWTRLRRRGIKICQAWNVLGLDRASRNYLACCHEYPFMRMQ
jgi:hypothetical protein